ncbi:hypothetical protein L0Y40_00110 [Candidatus Wolfebacteria bacterium]|nr:hypothetical protein [Candidatus Wolfebacteria bacterium]
MKINNTQPISDIEFERIIAERLSMLPADLKRAISDSQLDTHFLEIAQKNHLRVDESKTLENETMLALLGVEPLEDFGRNLERHAKFSPESAAAVTNDVNRLIFTPIRESLKQLWDEESREQHEEQTLERTQADTPLPETSLKEPGFAPTSRTTTSAPGVERTMPRDIVEAKLKGAVHTETEKHRVALDRDVPHAPPAAQDPYREPIE